LFSGSGLVTDPEQLATGGTVAQGVIADGASPLLIRIPAVNVGDNITVTIINDQGQPSSSAQQDGVLEPVNGSPNSGSVTVPAVSTKEGPMGFAVYIPPIDFSRGSMDNGAPNRSISLVVNEASPMTEPRSVKRANRTAAANSSPGKPVLIVRPPVVLVHGLWGDTTDWNGFMSLSNDPRFFVRTARYTNLLGEGLTASVPAYNADILRMARQNTLGFALNAPNVLMQIVQFITAYRTQQNVAGEQADVVAHSMGGVITRTAEYLSDFRFNGNNRVHKLITIDTPHLGTPVAGQLIADNNACVRGLMASGGNIAFNSVTLNGATVSGGAGDFQGDGMGGGLSPALQAIQVPNGHPVPTALIGGTINQTNLSGLNCTFCGANYIRQRCSGNFLADNLTQIAWPNVFGGAASDAIVPLSSQIPNNLSGTPFDGVIHSSGVTNLSFNGPDVLHIPESPVEVIGLLNAPVSSPNFHPLP
jgi:pimeloyl-ACP methyl ester carboxylesterase